MTARRIILLAVGAGLLLIGAAGLVLLLFPPAAVLRADVIERITGETPEARVTAYVQAVARGDARAAEAAWVLPAGEAQAEVSARREQFTREWIARGMRPEYTVQSIEWWRTCCEPGIIQDPRGAGGARVRVLWADRSGAAREYLFDVFTRGGAYWGSALGFPARQWELREAYPAEVQPVFWKFSPKP